MPDFTQLWIEDCSPSDLALKLTTFCHITGAKVTDDPSCVCVPHRATRTETAERLMANEKAKAENKNVELTAALEKIKDLSNQVTFFDAKVSQLSQELEKSKKTSAVAAFDASSGSKAAKFHEQEAAKFSSKFEDANNRANKAEAKLAQIEATLQGLL